VGLCAPEVAPERQPDRIGSSARNGHRDAQDRVGAELRLRRGTVVVQHGLVDACLVERLRPDHLRRDLVHDVFDRFQNTLAEIAAGVSIAQLESFMLTGRGARRNGSSSGRPSHQLHVDLDGRISSRV
jgi:hypothetical protein